MDERVPADASPEKRLFISLLTRDISLIAAFLDLIDNSVNAAIEPIAMRLETAEDYVEVLNDETVKPSVDIQLDFSKESVIIEDNAPGISADTAAHHVFRFGRSQEDEKESDRLSVYGLGLKRAFFKLGNRVRIVSDHVEGGFELDLDVGAWSRETEMPWKFDLARRPPVSEEKCGTTIEVCELYPETKRRMEDGVFGVQLGDAVSRTYSYFLATFVNINVNGASVSPTELKVGSNSATDHFQANDVSCAITAGLGTPENGKYTDRGSGWFVFCNGRTVISADKSSLTGWNNNGLPIFQPKHRPFLGTVYFVSRFADRLPWDSTKSGINEDSEIWQEAKRHMALVGKSITSFLDSRYTDEGTDIEMDEMKEATRGGIEAIVASSRPKSVFRRPAPPPRQTMQIQYRAKIENVDRIREFLSQPGMSGSEVGRFTFRFYLRNEVGDE